LYYRHQHLSYLSNLSEMSVPSFNIPTYPDLLVKHTMAERKEASKARKDDFDWYRIYSKPIPNSEYWDPFDTKNCNYRLARQALNYILIDTGKPWKGSLKGAVEEALRLRG